MPRSVGIRFSHAALQALAEDHGVDLLHIKGPAIDATLLDGPRDSIDADVLVRPSHVARLLDAMHRHGWSTQYRFEDGSAFEHASTLVHPILAPVDVHRRFPGIDADPSAAFDRLWADRHDADLAGVVCPVPSVTAQRVLLIVHAARAGDLRGPDIRRCWDEAGERQRAAMVELAQDIGGSVALAAGTGRLDEFVGAPTHELWRVLSSGERSHLRIWAARVKAAPSRRAAVRTAVRLVIPNRHRMETTLGRPPSRGEVTAAYVRSARRAARELQAALRSASGRRRRRR